MDYCGVCKNCRRGATNQCLDKCGDFGFNRDGGYAAFALVSETAFCPVPGNIPLREAPLLLDIMGTGGHAVTQCWLRLLGEAIPPFTRERVGAPWF